MAQSYNVSAVVLGKGLKSEVLVGVNKRTFQVVAVKVVEKFDETFVSRSQKEISILRKLSPPSGGACDNIIRMLDSWEDDSKVYMVLDKYEQTLLEYCCQHPRNDVQSTTRLFGQLVDALLFARRHNISHLDLKLENVMLTENADRAVLIDFGFAEEVSGDQKLSQARGSHHYLSPEMVKGQSFCPEKADVWSLGVVLYAMCTGTMPFADGVYDPGLIFAAIERGVFSLPHTVPAAAASLLHKMLEPDPDKRLDLRAVSKHPFASPQGYIARIGLAASLVVPPICSDAQDTSAIDAAVPLGRRRGGSAPHISVMSKEDEGERCGAVTLAEEPYHKEHLLQQPTSPPRSSVVVSQPWTSRAATVLPCLCAPGLAAATLENAGLASGPEPAAISEPDAKRAADAPRRDAPRRTSDDDPGEPGAPSSNSSALSLQTSSTDADDACVVNPSPLLSRSGSSGNDLRSMLRRSVFAQTLQSRYAKIVHGAT